MRPFFSFFFCCVSAFLVVSRPVIEELTRLHSTLCILELIGTLTEVTLFWKSATLSSVLSAVHSLLSRIKANYRRAHALALYLVYTELIRTFTEVTLCFRKRLLF